MNVAGTILRRGLEAHATHGDKVQVQLPTWGVVMLSATFIVYCVALFTIEYTFGRLVPTLLMIESPQDSISFEPLATEDPDSMIKDPEPLSKPQLITSSFRRTLRHLGGFQARFRGISMFLVNAMLVNWIAGILSVLPFINMLPRGLTNVAAAVLCAQFSLGWTHIVISQPSPKVWYRRVPPMKMWKKVIGPTAVLALAEQMSIWIPIYFSILAGLTDNAPGDVPNMTPHEKTVMSLKGLGIIVFGLVFSFLVIIPANVALTRVQASLLDDSEDTIVPFDRSFGGKVVPEIVGGSGKIGMLDAWKSFDWASRIRLVKAYLKVLAIQVAVTFLFTFFFISQLFIILGNDWSKLTPEAGNN